MSLEFLWRLQRWDHSAFLSCTACGVAGREAAAEQCRIPSLPASFLPPLRPPGKSMAMLQTCRITTGTPAPTEEML